MTPKQLAEARHRLGLTLEQFAFVLGYEGSNLRAMGYAVESGVRRLREPQRRLLQAYMSGYRPKDWPQK